MKPSYALVFVLCVLLSACASLGLEPAKSPADRIAYGYSTYTAVVQAAANSVRTGDISKADGATILKLSDEARTLLDAAQAIVATDPQGATTKLNLALVVLTNVQTYLRKT